MGNIKTVAIIIGLILSIIGLVMENWKLAVIGNSIAIFGALFT